MRIIVISLVLLFGGCAQYGLVKAGPQKVKAITVSPSQEWNRVPAMVSPGGVPTWTADGISLNSISFFSEIKDGQSLVKSTKKEQYLVFRSNMLPTEVVELVESTFAKLYQATISKSGTLRPIEISGNPGFEYTFEFVTPDQLPRRSYVAGTIKNEQLHLIFYQAARLHYYDRHIQSVTNMVETATLD